MTDPTTPPSWTSPPSTKPKISWGALILLAAVLLFGGAALVSAITDDDSASQDDAIAEQPYLEDDEPTYSPPATSRYTPPASRWDADEQAYLMLLDSESVPYTSESAAIEVAHALCTYLDDGGNVWTAGVMAMEDGGYTESQAGTIVGAAVGGICPRHMNQIPN